MTHENVSSHFYLKSSIFGSRAEDAAEAEAVVAHERRQGVGLCWHGAVRFGLRGRGAVDVRASVCWCRTTTDLPLGTLSLPWLTLRFSTSMDKQIRLYTLLNLLSTAACSPLRRLL